MKAVKLEGKEPSNPNKQGFSFDVSPRISGTAMKMSDSNITDQILDVGYEEFLPFFDGFSEGLLIVDRPFPVGAQVRGSGIVMGLAWATGAAGVLGTGALADAIGPVSATLASVPVALAGVALALHPTLRQGRGTWGGPGASEAPFSGD